jgi:hypothetical protein
MTSQNTFPRGTFYISPNDKTIDKLKNMWKEKGRIIRNTIPAFFQRNWRKPCPCSGRIERQSVTATPTCSVLQYSLMVAPYLRQWVAGFLPWRFGFDPTSSHLEFVVDNVVPGVGFLRVFRFPLPNLNLSTTSNYLISSYVGK